MIKTSRQLKDLVRNKSGGNSNKAQIIIRNYMMERFLERLSVSLFKENFILKGGMLISSMVGIENRSTMDIDTTIRSINLSADDISNVLTEIIAIQLDDGVSFNVKSISKIMDEAEYPGIRVMLEATLENMHTPLKIDFSTGDAITPKEIVYDYKLMFENRSISILAYNTETILAEKLETIITRSTTNTRLRDFYDLRILYDMVEIDYDKLKAAFFATSERRNSTNVIKSKYSVIKQLENDKGMKKLWANYQRKYDNAGEYTWQDIIVVLNHFLDKV